MYYLYSGSYYYVTYKVSNQSMCENYIATSAGCSDDSECLNMCTTYCTGGSYNGFTLKKAIENELIPSSDYAEAGLSNVTIESTYNYNQTVLNQVYPGTCDLLNAGTKFEKYSCDTLSTGGMRVIAYPNGKASVETYSNICAVDAVTGGCNILK